MAIAFGSATFGGVRYGARNRSGYGQARYNSRPSRYGSKYGAAYYAGFDWREPTPAVTGESMYGSSWYGTGPHAPSFYGQIMANFRHRTLLGEQVQAQFVHRSQAYETMRQRFVHRSSNSKVQARFTHRSQAYGQPLRQRFIHRSRAYAGQVTITLPPMNGSQQQLVYNDYDLAWQTGIGDLGGATFTPAGPEPLCPQSFRVTYNESAPSGWEIPVKSPQHRVSPLNLKSGWQDVLDIGRSMTAQLTWGGMPFNYRGISTGYGHTREWQGRRLDFTWRGKDLAQKLTAPDQTMQTVRNRMASDVVREILDHYGVQHNLHQLYADDFLIHRMDRQKGVPMQWITDILAVPVLEWKMAGGVVFTPYLPEGGAGATWTYTSETVLFSENLDADLEYLYNKIIVVLARENAEVQRPNVVTSTNPETELPETQPTVEGAPPVEVNEFREYTLEFDPPVDALRWRVISAEGGMFSDFWAYNKQGQVVGYRSPRPPSSIPQALGAPPGTEVTGFPTGGGLIPRPPIGDGALNGVAKVKFTWGEAPGNITVQSVGGGVVYVSNAGVAGYGRIEFMGNRGSPMMPPPAPQPGGGSIPPGEGPDGVESVTQLRIEYVDPVALAAANGIVRELELQATPLISDPATALKHGQRTLRRISRQKRESAWAVPLNHLMEPGDKMQVVEEELGRVRQFVVKTPVHTFDSKPSGRGTTVQLVEYPTTVAPPVISVLRFDPVHQAEGVQRTQQINIFFSHELDPAECDLTVTQVASPNAVVPGSWRVVNTCILRFTPDAPTDLYGEEVEVSFTAVAKLAAASSINGSFNFTYGMFN